MAKHCVQFGSRFCDPRSGGSVEKIRPASLCRGSSCYIFFFGELLIWATTCEGNLMSKVPVGHEKSHYSGTCSSYIPLTYRYFSSICPIRARVQKLHRGRNSTLPFASIKEHDTPLPLSLWDGPPPSVDSGVERRVQKF